MTLKSQEIVAARLKWVDKEIARLDRNTEIIRQNDKLTPTADLVATTKRAELLNERLHLLQFVTGATSTEDVQNEELRLLMEQPDFLRVARAAMAELAIRGDDINMAQRAAAFLPVGQTAGAWCDSCTFGACTNCVHCVPNGVLK